VPGRALVSALLILLALAACGGKGNVEDAPALLGSGIPAAAPDARGVDLPPAHAPMPRPVPTAPKRPLHRELEDPFATPQPPPKAAQPEGGVPL
jgi:hypothetical protein